MSGVKLLSKSKSKEHHPSNKSTSSSGYSGVQKASKSTSSRLGAFYSAGPVLSLGGSVQAKMNVGSTDDPYEREADSVADRIMTGGRIFSISRIFSGGMGSVAQRQEEGEEEEELIQANNVPGHDAKITPSVESHIMAMKGSGEPLPESTRAFFEPRFGRDFSGVRVHTDSRAAESAWEVNARAYTVGHDIAFGAGQYASGTSGGQKLLAHELTHVVQQQNSKKPYMARYIDAWTPGMMQYKQSQRRAPKLSFELENAPKAATAKERVKLWLGKYLHEIAGAEKKFRIDRRAIAGAIAWEAMENIKSSWTTLRAVGPGKVHYKAGYFSEGELCGGEEPIAKEVEKKGYLPERTLKKRKEILKKPSIAIEYIGAIMGAIADTAEKYGHCIRCDPSILTNTYQGSNLKAWDEHLKKKKKGSQLRPGNKMALWTQKNIKYLEDCVGKQSPNICACLSAKSKSKEHHPSNQSTSIDGDVEADEVKLKINYKKAEKRNKYYAGKNILGWDSKLAEVEGKSYKNWADLWKDGKYNKFADAVAAHQVKLGFSGKNVDGVLGLGTWAQIAGIGEAMAGIKRVFWRDSEDVCTKATKERIKRGHKIATGKSIELPDDKNMDIFNAILQSIPSRMLDVNLNYRGTGAAGALVYTGLGEFISEGDIWSGKLKPGAVIQVWGNKNAYDLLRSGKIKESGVERRIADTDANFFGTSLVFVRYDTRSFKRMLVRHYGLTQWKSKGSYAVWVAANVKSAEKS